MPLDQMRPAARGCLLRYALTDVLARAVSKNSVQLHYRNSGLASKCHVGRQVGTCQVWYRQGSLKPSGPPLARH
eukprot:2396887-Amphidinium_carterae.2